MHGPHFWYATLSCLLGIVLNFTHCTSTRFPIKTRSIIHPLKNRVTDKFSAAVILLFASLLVTTLFGAISISLHYFFTSFFISENYFIILGVIFFISGVIELTPISILLPQKIVEYKGYGLAGAFKTGSKLMLFAIPCSLTILVCVVLFSFTLPYTLSATVFIGLGVGLALPYFIGILTPQLLDLFSRFNWEAQIKYLLALGLFYAGVYFGQVFISDKITFWLFKLVQFCAGIWFLYFLLRPYEKYNKVLAVFLGLLFLSAKISLVPTAKQDINLLPYSILD